MERFTLVAIVVLVNLLATRAVWRADQPGARKWVSTLIAWAIPLVGAVIAMSRIPAGGASSGGKADMQPEQAPLLLEGSAQTFDLTAHLLDGNGVPILDWSALAEWADSQPAGAQESAIERGRRAWLLHFRDVMGPHAHLHENEHVLLLSSYQPRIAKATARYVSATRHRISTLLEGITKFPAGEKSILVVLDSQDDYYTYIANYYPEEGEFSFSGGMFVSAGCPHFVAVQADLSLLEPVIAHEMTHSALAHLQLPLWLDEGIAVSTERRLAPVYDNPNVALEVLAKHRGFWNAERMQDFWTGESFQVAGDSNQLSYDLARHIVELLGREWSSFMAFVAKASRADGGAAAATEILRLDLGALAAAAVGMQAEIGWSPTPASWKSTRVRVELDDAEAASA